MRALPPFLAGLFLLLPFPQEKLSAQTQPAVQDAPVDRPVQGGQDEIEKNIAPYIAMSRKLYPPAREKFLKGLPKGYSFYVTIGLRDEKSKTFEQIFVLVEKMDGETISGRIASDVTTVPGHMKNDPITCQTVDIRDWTITAPDGSEEGNYVGRFLDVLQDGKVPIVLKVAVKKDGSIDSAVVQGAYNRYRQDVSYCIPAPIFKEAEVMATALKLAPPEKPGDKFIYLFYHWKEKKLEAPENL